MSTLPLLRGHIQTFYVKHGGRRLGPYYARVWKQNGRRRRQYVPAHLVEEVRAACHSYRLRRKRQQEKRAELERILGNLSFLTRACRRANRIDQLLPHEQDHVRRIQENGVATPGRPQIKRARRFMGPLRLAWLQKYARGMGFQPMGASGILPVREEPQPEQPQKKPFRRYWRLQHELPTWFTEELWEEMAARIPKDKP